MPALKVLFVGGTGLISAACVERAMGKGLDVTVLNRGASTLRPLSADVDVITVDIRDPSSVKSALARRSFDVVADFLTYTPKQAALALELFRGRTAQYVFISSTAAYQMPPPRLPIVESTVMHSPHRQYSSDKAACEDVFLRAFREEEFPITILRPAHTYDRTYPVSAPISHWTVIDRIRHGRPVVVPGDGTSLYVLTHATDFARGFVGVLGNQRTIGESFHVTSEETLTWSQIYGCYAAAVGGQANLVHVLSETIARLEPALGPELMDFTSHSMIYDNSKIRTIVPDYAAAVPFSAGAREIVDWHNAFPDRQALDQAVNETIDRLVEGAASRW